MKDQNSSKNQKIRAKDSFIVQVGKHDPDKLGIDPDSTTPELKSYNVIYIELNWHKHHKRGRELTVTNVEILTNKDINYRTGEFTVPRKRRSIDQSALLLRSGSFKALMGFTQLKRIINTKCKYGNLYWVKIFLYQADTERRFTPIMTVINRAVDKCYAEHDHVEWFSIFVSAEANPGFSSPQDKDDEEEDEVNDNGNE